MSAYFADTFFFLALVSETDESHGRAQAMVQSLTGRLYTTMFVLTEVGDALAAPTRRGRFVPLLDFLRSNSLVTITPLDQAVFDRGTALFDQRRDKSWSLTDCISFVVMQDFGLRDALTADHHFEQAGFNILLK
jgi:hypothetical protein